MAALWDIAIGKTNPDGTMRTTRLVKTEEDIDKGLSDEPKADTEMNVLASVPRAEVPTHQPQSDGPASEEDAETEMHVNYETIDGKQVVVSKRTKHRVWRQFENGKHSTFLP